MIIDTAVHPVLGDSELRRLISQPWASAQFPHPLGARYSPPYGGYAVSDADSCVPEAIETRLFQENGVAAAILSPLGRGLRPNPHENAAVAGGINQWQADRWLSRTPEGGRFFGTIRLSMTDVGASVDELGRWADDQRFVAVAVPLRTFLPYGDEFYMPIWRAVEQTGLPVIIVDDMATGVANAETPVGPTRYFAEKHALAPMSSLIQMSSLITCGVLDRLPGLRFILGTASLDLTRFMIWKIEKDWRMGRIEIPWVKRLPGLYLADHFRFVGQPEDATLDGFTFNDAMLELSDAHQLTVYGSRFPYWDYQSAGSTMSGWPDRTRRRILGENALAFMPRLAAALKVPS